MSVAVCLLAGAALLWRWGRQPVLRITDWETGDCYYEVAVAPGDRVFFGWTHSLEGFPWHEYYHIDADWNLVLDTIAITNYAAGIPERKGSTYWTEDGMMYMGEINQVFASFVWIHSQQYITAITIGNQFSITGWDLPEHRRLCATIERRGVCV